ncbi:hypothetical protein N9406_01150 [Verrucomicrobiales bacterium]|jgi:hypothetical protein|nr:hypothetical protein [Verrucomicrobiales bacterium]MDB3939542.1 hypothetical protein [Verrucomicrobiales bacterium]
MKEYFSPITIAITALLATTALTSCTDRSEPGLTLTPIEFGGEHASLLSVITGNSFAYRVQYDGHSTSYRIDMELFEAGELTAKRQLLAGIFADLAQNSIQDESIDMLLAFMVTDPRREGDSTEITAVLSNPPTSFHKDIQIAEWDALGGRGGSSYSDHHERMHFQSTSEPIVLYRWWKGDHLQSLTDPSAKESRVCMQLVLHLEK